MINRLSIFIFLFATLAMSLSHAQEKKRTWFEIQQEKVYALNEYKETQMLKDSLEKAKNESFTLSVSREPCDICAKWDIALYDKDRNYFAYYVVKFRKKDNAVEAVHKLHTKNGK